MPDQVRHDDDDMSLAVRRVVVAALLSLTSCAWPTRDHAEREAIVAEANALMRAYRARDEVRLPRDRWPPTIAALEPESVTIGRGGVDIWTKPHLDGGWGYFVPAKGRKRPRPGGCMTDLGYGIYWYEPC